jgi:hypothetical protein
MVDDNFLTRLKEIYIKQDGMMHLFGKQRILS